MEIRITLEFQSFMNEGSGLLSSERWTPYYQSRIPAHYWLFDGARARQRVRLPEMSSATADQRHRNLTQDLPYTER